MEINTFKNLSVRSLCVVLGFMAHSARSEQQPAPAAATPASATTATNNAVTSNQSDVLLLSVDKSSLKAELRTWPEDFTQSKVLKTYRIAVGKQDGDKERKGDNRTPEGIYIAQSEIDETLPREKYGPKAIPLNFPNPMDHLAGKTGYGIWLHGAGNDQRIEEAKTTEGCVVFYNNDIETLGKWVRPQQGIVVIAKDAKLVNQPADLAAVKAETEGWMSDWSNRRLDEYIGRYIPDFVYSGKSRDGYKKYKKAVFASYKVMTIKFENMRVITHPKYALSIMNQDFKGDKRFSVVGRKLLYWAKSPDGKWRIKYELFDKHNVELVSFADATSELSARQSQNLPPNL